MSTNFYVIKAKNNIKRPQRIRFLAAENQTNFNLFQYASDYGVVLPDSQYFDVYINDQKTDQEYTSISFNTDDIVTIQLNNEDQFYPCFLCYFYGENGIVSFNVIKEVLEPLPVLKISKNKEVSIFQQFFQNCTNLTNIPENLFINNLNVSNFSNCFGGCSSLTSIPENLFFVNDQIVNLTDCFNQCTNLKNFRLKIGSPNVKYVNNFILADSNGTVIVPDGSTTYDSFVKANISGLTIETF